MNYSTLKIVYESPLKCMLVYVHWLILKLYEDILASASCGRISDWNFH